MFNKRIYLDNASLTPIDKRVIKEMRRYSGPEYANVSSWYKEGVNAKQALETARKEVASFLHAQPDEITFTAGGTEANNLAILGVIENLHNQGMPYEEMNVLVSVIEHSSIRECVNHLNNKGVTTDVVAVSEAGIIDLDDLKRKIKPNTVLVSIMTVNNEIGTIQPIKEIAKIIRSSRKSFEGKSPFKFQDIAYPLLHTDASQALYQDLFVEKLNIDMLTLDGSKIYGPRGLGALYVKKGIVIQPVIFGGGQENNLRSGTENLPAIAGFAKALELLTKEKSIETERILFLKSLFIKELKEINTDIKVNGDINHSSPHILNIQIPGLDSEFFIFQLDAKGIACSTKSSCLRDENESYVLKAIGAKSNQSLRISFGRFNSESDVRKALKVFKTLLNIKRR